MNIVLTQKDADWVANVLREQIKDLQEAYDEAMAEGNKRSELCSSLIKTISDVTGESEECESAMKELSQVGDSARKKLSDRYNKKMTTYCKILELMMCGSESLEA